MDDFAELVHKFYMLYGKKAYAEALALIEEALPNFSEHQVEIITWKISMQSRLGQNEAAIQTLRTAIETSTYWWHPGALRADSDLAGLQDDAEFQRLLSICETRRHAALLEGHSERLVFAPKATDSKKLPLLISLHGWGQNAQMDAPHWQGLADQGWLVAVTRSSYQAADKVYTWDDLERAFRDTKSHYEALTRDFSVNPERIVLAGFSQGAGRALWMALTQSIPAHGFIGVGPYLEIDKLAASLAPNDVPNLRVYLISGSEENDEGIFAKVGALCAKHTIPFHHQVIPGIGHEYPSDFAATLKNALAFIFPAEG